MNTLEVQVAHCTIADNKQLFLFVVLNINWSFQAKKSGWR